MEDKRTTLDRAAVVNSNFLEALQIGKFPQPKSSTTFFDVGIDKNHALAIFQSQVESRHLDLIARDLKNKHKSFYTIGSSGHEGNAAVASAFSVEDMAFLHYRSCAFMLQRARDYYKGDSRLEDHLLALVASSKDPIASGRHKVFGSKDLNVPPQTSTIGSHVPKAVGAAFSITLTKSLNIKGGIHPASCIICSFGDGSLNHSTVQGAINSASWIVENNIPLPIVFVCEDNQIAISTPTKNSWVRNTCIDRVGIEYIDCDGLNIADTYLAAKQAREIAAHQRRPVFLHVKTVRLLGHAGSDIEFHYNNANEIISRENDDPLLHTARMLIESNYISALEITSIYKKTKALIEKISEKAIKAPTHKNYKTIIKDVIPPKLNKKIPSIRKNEKSNNNIAINKLNMAQCINNALDDILNQYDNVVIFGEDVGKKGGVYRVTANLQKKYGKTRVFDSILDEQTILGTAIGLAHNNIIPIPEIQFLAYVHNAIDQIRGEAATLPFFSSGQFVNPMVVRIPGLAYQKGFGGHFHNDNSIGFLREIPGIIVACPSTPAKAAKLIRKCIELAYIEQRVVIFLEPIALYHEKDLLEVGDNKFLEEYPDVSSKINFNEIDVNGSSKKYSIITFGNGVRIAEQAKNILENKYKCKVKLIDLCWLSPINYNEVLKEISNLEHVLILDETRDSGSVADDIISNLYLSLKNNKHQPILHKITAQDSFIPLGNSWKYVLPSSEDVINFFETKILQKSKSGNSVA